MVSNSEQISACQRVDAKNFDLFYCIPFCYLGSFFGYLYRN